MNTLEIAQLPLTDEEQVTMLVEAGEDGAADLIEELLGLFETEAGPQLETLERVIKGGSYAEASRPAHAVAGSSANLGGLRLSKLAKAMEHAAMANQGDRLHELLPLLRGCYVETVASFRTEIERLR